MKPTLFGDQYDWTTGGPYDGNDWSLIWRKYRVVPCAHPVRPCVLAFGSKGAFRHPGAMWDHFRCTVEPSSGHIRRRTSLGGCVSGNVGAWDTRRQTRIPTPESTRVSLHFLKFGVGQGVFWRRDLFKNVHILEILEKLENLEILETPQSVENKGESDHFPEILEYLEIVEILEVPPVKDPFRNDPFFRSRQVSRKTCKISLLLGQLFCMFAPSKNLFLF